MSRANLDELRAMAEPEGCAVEFLMAVPARRYKELTGLFREMAFDEAGLAEGRFEGERLVVSHDPKRAAQQTARRRKTLGKLKAMGQRMASKLDALDRGQPTRGRPITGEEAYGRLVHEIAKAKMTRFIQARFDDGTFGWTVNEGAILDAELHDGKLAVVTNTSSLCREKVISGYKDLARIERSFRVLKSDIKIAPVHHRLPDRIRAHAQICFLALVLDRVMEIRLKAAGSVVSASKARDTLRQLKRHRIRVGTKIVEKASPPSEKQLELFKALNLPKPA